MKTIGKWGRARLAAVALAALGAWQAQATEYVVPAGGDVGKWFAQLPGDATAVVFSAAEKYRSEGDIVLPAKGMLVIDGRGCRLALGKDSNGFTYPVTSMKEAMERTNCRYIIRDFASITGGRKAVDLKGSMGSMLENLDLVAQTEAAVDLRFCLLTRMANIRVTNPRDKGIVLRQGDWPGANGMNSQCNSSVLEQVRVYCAITTTASFTILNSNGVRMTDCVSEGSPCDYDIFLSATLDGDESRPASNPVVKSFMLSGFHVEHDVRKASIYVNMPSKAVVELNNVYWNGAIKAPVVLYTLGQVTLSNIGWWNPSFWIGSRVSAPRISIVGGPNEMDPDWQQAKGAKPTIVRMVDALPGNTELKMNYVQVQRKSM
ncbi:MAG: hypothetical protein JST98_07905 [Bacteroidetes bacterium]|nr:hypothetical protein [Bacteroidota bacterium]MBS1945108.1 hypothetical protein [Bacteroidota bacterium]